MATINKNLSVYDKVFTQSERFSLWASNAEWNEEITEGLYNGS
jgi:hypothetical protein